MSTEDTSAKLLKQMEELMRRMKIWKTDLSSKERLFLLRRKFLPIRKALLITILTIPEAVAEARARVGRPQTSSSPPPSNFTAGRPKAALLFWFFGGFRCGVPLFIVMLVVY